MPEGPNVVIAATRDDGCVGYFKTEADVPPEFKYPGKEDITGVMKGFRTTSVEKCLEFMNSHWKRSQHVH